MAVDERQRNLLHTRLEQVLGGEEAATLMSYLPPVGWADVATKRDLDHLADRLRLELRGELHREVGGLRAELGSLRDRIDDKLDANLRVLLFSMLGAVFTTAGLAFGAAQL